MGTEMRSGRLELLDRSGKVIATMQDVPLHADGTIQWQTFDPPVHLESGQTARYVVREPSDLPVVVTGIIRVDFQRD